MGILLAALLLAQQTEDPYAWFDALKYPDQKDLPYVRVFTGETSKRPGHEPEAITFEAFLLKDEGKTFTVLGLRLTQSDYKKRSSGIPEERIDYEVIDIEKAARKRIDDLKAPQKEEERGFGRRGPSVTEFFVLARGCDRQGRKDIAQELLQAAAAFPDRSTGKPSEKPLSQVVASEIALGRIWQAVRDFGNPEISREQLLDTFSDFAKKFPDTEYAALARETVELLKTMVSEDTAHVIPKLPLEKLPTQDRVRELIFRLRDQNGLQLSQPGQCDFFADPRGEESPAHQLVAIGFEAVPQLIAVLEDSRFTRSVGFHRDFHFSHHVLRVGDVALAVLEKIAGKRFFERTYTNGAMTKDNAAKTTRAAVQAWWDSFQKKGEKDVLVEAAEKGDVLQARRLLEKYPDLALPALAKALGNAKEPHVRGALIAVVTKIPGDSSTAILSKELKEGPHAGTRMMAAREMIRRGCPEVLPALVEEWKKSAVAKRDSEEEFFERPTEGIIAALVATGKPEAIRALALDFGKRSLRDRVSVLCGLSDGTDFFTLDPGAEKGDRPPGVTSENEQESAKIAEDLLASVLDDMTVLEGRSASRPGMSFSDPRFCDVAAYIMASRWPKKYIFDMGAGRKARDRQRGDVQNVWRRSRGLDALPVQADAELAPLAASVVDPLVDSVLRGEAGSEEALASKGLPALKGAQARLEKLGGNRDHKAALEAIVRQLGCSVAEAKLTPAPTKKDDALAALISGLQGKPLTPESLRSFVEKVPTVFPEGVVGFRMTVERDTDLSGLRVVVETVTETVPKGRSVGKWAMSEIVMLGQEGLLNYGGNSRGNYATSSEGWKMLKEPVETVFMSPVAKSFSIRISRIQMK